MVLMVNGLQVVQSLHGVLLMMGPLVGGPLVGGPALGVDLLWNQIHFPILFISVPSLSSYPALGVARYDSGRARNARRQFSAYVRQIREAATTAHRR